MNIEKAIEVLAANVGCAELDISNGEGNTHTEEFAEAGRMAIELMKKETPLKPDFQSKNLWFCQNCSNGHVRHYMYCPNCGQHFYWPEYEEKEEDEDE